MSVPAEVEAHHRVQAEIAKADYVSGLTSPLAAAEWHSIVMRARRDIISALKASNGLTDLPAALAQSGAHLRVFRYLLAPPISQDQFKLLCPAYSKSRENNGSAITGARAAAVCAAILAARNVRLTPWLDRGDAPKSIEVRALLHAVAPMLSQQIIATVSRNRLAATQEGAVIALLASKGWTRVNSGLIQSLSDVPASHYMHKTRFATTTQPQEVDIACGLGKTIVLAMECKVTNDPLNSIKRINDVLKKATAWQAHWGSFVRTAALLQGVINYNDVHRLLAANVEVFWSHKLEDFEAWLDANVA